MHDAHAPRQLRRIAVVNQKGGVGKTTTCANLGAALARSGRRVCLVDMDPQANLTTHLGQEVEPGDASCYTVLSGATPLAAAVRRTSTPGLSIVPAHIDLSGAELELASAIGRETRLREAIDDWERAGGTDGGPPADYVILDCPPSLGLLSINALAAAHEVILAVQTEFFALQGMSKLVEVVQLLQRRLNPDLELRGILACLYDRRLRLAREVLAELRRYFGEQVFQTAIRSNVKLAEAPSHGRTIFEYGPTSPGAKDYAALAEEVLAQESGAAPEHQGPLTAPGGVEAMETRLQELARGDAKGQQTDAIPATSSQEAPNEVPAAGPEPADRAKREVVARPELEEVDIPRPPQNFGSIYGEDRARLAGPWGPRR